MTITALTPRLVVDDAAAAIAFYVAAFGAVEHERVTDDSGRVAHALVVFDGGSFAIKDEGAGDPAPGTIGGTPVIFTLDTPDAGDLADRLVDAGATVVFPVDDHGYGYLDGRLADPFGHLWIVSQKL